jgi:integrase/recombinase XerD
MPKALCEQSQRLCAGDVIALRLKDIEWNQANIRVSGKGRREAPIPLTQEVGDALIQYLRFRQDPLHASNHFFISARAPLRPLFADGTVSTMVARALRHAGVHSPVRGAHVLRHTCAMIILQATHDIRKVSLWLGHASMQSTEAYTQADPMEKLEAIEAITPPALRRGRFKQPDKLLALLHQA